MGVQFKTKVGVAIRFCATVFLALGVMVGSPLKGYAMKIQEITTPGGIKALLVEEHTIPMLAMQFAFKGGASQEEDGKEGIAYLISALLDEGAGDMTSSQMQATLDELAIRMSFDASQDLFSGSFQTLSKNRDKAIEILKLALTKPRFDTDAIERMRKQILVSLKMGEKDPDTVASKAWFKAAFPNHPYGRSTKGTIKSMTAITRDDLVNFVTKTFARDNLTVAVVGDIDAKTLSDMLDSVFGSLPKNAQLKKIPDAKPPIGPVLKVVEMDVPQSVAQYGHSAIKRHDKDFIPAYILNYILGGGGFSSRLMEEVREKNGLAYSVYSYLYPMDHASLFMGGVATKNASMNKSIKMIKDEIRKMADKGPTEKELKNAKLYLTGSYALRFDTSSKIANQLMWIQIENLGLDYFDKRNDMVSAVSLEDMRRVAKRLFQADKLITTIVGKPG